MYYVLYHRCVHINLILIKDTFPNTNICRFNLNLIWRFEGYQFECCTAYWRRSELIFWLGNMLALGVEPADGVGGVVDDLEFTRLVVVTVPE